LLWKTSPFKTVCRDHFGYVLQKIKKYEGDITKLTAYCGCNCAAK